MLPYKASYHKQWYHLAGKIEIPKYSRQKAQRIQCSYYSSAVAFFFNLKNREKNKNIFHAYVIFKTLFLIFFKKCKCWAIVYVSRNSKSSKFPAKSWVLLPSNHLYNVFSSIDSVSSWPVALFQNNILIPSSSTKWYTVSSSQLIPCQLARWRRYSKRQQHFLNMMNHISS
jgi:hypothetical protein